MGVCIDEARRQHVAPAVNPAPRGIAVQLADGLDTIRGDGHTRRLSFSTPAIQDDDIADQRVATGHKVSLSSSNAVIGTLDTLLTEQAILNGRDCRARE